MRLATLGEFRSLFYTPDSALRVDALRRHVDKGLVPGGRVNAGRYYVDLDEWDRVNNVRPSIENQKEQLARSPELEGLL